ncbi:hypothetical protein I7I50_11047 [Histoplasma capsulatum G186AR]|uniref:Uncharacterized protein n=1 Tax=Ajellomyces capsulatus TaxID=5037 RepID=A0A8H7ZAC2_AJECA|nr:hypothetical protein I7I52_02286 [Histoplasma capsulatum]QSS69676.1 hypothetical protein I7I50_11047 [Histoplasma capsulatum G186AR]
MDADVVFFRPLSKNIVPSPACSSLTYVFLYIHIFIYLYYLLSGYRIQYKPDTVFSFSVLTLHSSSFVLLNLFVIPLPIILQRRGGNSHTAMTALWVEHIKCEKKGKPCTVHRIYPCILEIDRKHTFALSHC